MDMEIARMSTLSLLQIPARQVVSLRAVQPPVRQSWGNVTESSSMVVQRVPMLDWPANLFEDKKFYH